MAGDNNPIRVEIKAPITFVICGITEEDTQCGARRKLMGGGG
jgi:hypothetical protein